MTPQYLKKSIQAHYMYVINLIKHIYRVWNLPPDLHASLCFFGYFWATFISVGNHHHHHHHHNGLAMAPLNLSSL